ncbi:hypothetical protein B7463_g896, partial [Scytalidium lignicola]
MSGRKLLREPAGESLCAFCAHRLGTTRRSSYVQRRFIRSSRSNWNPPATGEALCQSEDGSEQAIGATWGRGFANANASSAPSWGKPSFGNGGIPSSIPIPTSTGDIYTNGIERASEPAGGMEQNSNSSQSPPDLLPHEQRAREFMLESTKQSQQRPIKVHAGAGPENTRAGRPLPQTDVEKPANTERSADRTRTAPVHNRKTEVKSRHGSFTIRKFPSAGRIDPVQPKHPQSSIVSRIEYQRESQNDEKPATWNMLRKRNEPTSHEQPQPQDDAFAAARARRESSTKGYEPLGAASYSLFKRDSTLPSSKGPAAQTQAVSAKTAEIHDMSQESRRPSGTKYRKNDVLLHQKSQESGISRQEVVEKPPAIERTVRFSPLSMKREEVTRDETRKKYTESLEKDEGPRSKESKRGGRDASTKKASYTEIPKGRDRDKARRRQQFIEDGAENEEDREAARRAELRRQRKAEKAAKKAAAPTPILLPEYISVSNLAVALKVRLEDFVVKMEELGFEATNPSHIVNAENAGLIAQEYNFEPIIDRGESEDLKARPEPEDPSVLPQRPPVVTIMGHVDHGKTTLLDWLRKSSVAATEHGGITQHIGAFSVPLQSGRTITFLDTPGHAAFLSMRQRGANVTDIVVLVVAADDSVKPQTIEAINHAKAARVPIIVAINKIDKEDANVERVKQDLARHGVDVEDYGGDTQVVCVSGKTGQGMEDLEESVLTLSEILDMRSETDGQAEGWIIEASIKAVGKVATVLVKRGTMRPGDYIVAGKTWARIRCLRNSAGVEISAAGPGTPVEIDGWREQPLAGDEVIQAPDEGKAKSVVEYRLEKEERDKMADDMEAINETRRLQQEARGREKKEGEVDAEGAESADVAPAAEVGGPKQIHFIIKGDVSGSVEAVVDSVAAIGNAEVRPYILRSGVGQISEWDIEHAATAKGYIINFNTPIDGNISRQAEAAKVGILDHNIIYRLVDDVKEKLSEHLPPLVTQRVLGEAEIAQTFEITVKGRQQKSIAGCKIRNGTVNKGAKVRVLRGGEKIFDGSLASLKNVKKDITEASKGMECGVGFENWFDFQVGDKVQSYEVKEEKRYL